MPITFTCTCGKQLHAPDSAAGRRARCPRCQSVVIVPMGDELELQGASLLSAPKPAVSPMPATRSISDSGPALAYAQTSQRVYLRRFAYLLLVLALLPLIFSTFFPHEDHSAEVLQAIQDHPELVARIENGAISRAEFMRELFDTLPNDRVSGALLPHETHAHWLYALGASAAYFLLLLLLFPHAARFTKGLLFAGIFTGTAGIIVLLGFQWAAFSMPLIIPRGVIGLVLLLVKLIGYCYALADNPDVPWILSFVGYTCGVGLCEEFTKAIPMLFRIRQTPGSTDPTWNSMLLWGLASGIGFGIAESIMYSGRYYNGMAGADMYWTRFISCVALHAMWAGAVGISIYRRQGDILNAANNWEYFFRVVLIIIVPMTLHGLYDTLLGKDHDVLALLVALATFGWLAFQIERQQRAEPLTA